MIQKPKTFYGSLAVLAFALVLGACPDKPDEPDNNTPALMLSGQVYIQSTDPSSLLNPPKFGGNLRISDGGLGGNGEIKNGKLNYAIIGVPPLSPINEVGGMDYLKKMYSSLTFSSEDANAAAVVLITDSDEYSGLLKSSLGPDLSQWPTIKLAIETVNYMYVDKDLQITADPYTFTYTEFDFPVSLTTGNINLSLKKGWNSLYSKITADIPPDLNLSDPDLTDFKLTGTLGMSVADPANLKWTLIPSQAPDF